MATIPIPEPRTQTALMRIANEIGQYARIPLKDATDLSRFDFYKEAGGRVVVQDVLKRKRVLDTVIPGWVLVTFREEV